MKKILLLTWMLSMVFSCKKDGKVAETMRSDSENTGTDAFPADSAALIAPAQSGPRLRPLNEDSDIGKVVFKQNNLVMIAFNTQSQTGKIVIDDKEYALNKLTFAENNYEISGNGIKIVAEDGNFKEMNSDCLYGNFPNVKIVLNQKEINLENVDVQDCPAY